MYLNSLNQQNGTLGFLKHTKTLTSNYLTEKKTNF